MSAAAALLCVRIGVLGIFAPTHVTVEAGGVHHDVALVGRALRVDGREAGAARLRVEGRPLVTVAVLGVEGPRITRRFRGTLEITVATAGAGATLRLVDELAESDYLPGTVALESLGAEPEALATQAVLARTYLRRGARHAAEGYALCDLTHCQTYRGADGETEAARRAVAATVDEVLVHDGAIAAVYFTSACGGATADAADVWPGAGASYLRSVPCEACTRRGGSPWRADLALADVDRAVGGAGRLRGLTVTELGAGGIVRRVRLDGDGRVLDGESLRIAIGRALGWSHVKSDRFTVERSGDRLRFAGRGAGHGVGLCEEGAAELARGGLDHRAILARYFPGVVLARRPPPAAP